MNPNIAVVTAFLKAFKEKQLSDAPLAPRLSYESPLTGEPIRGRDHVIRFLNVYVPIIKDIRAIRHIADADYVATVLQADTTFGSIPLVYVFHVVLGEIVEIQTFYDPRGFLEQMGSWSVA